MIDRAQRFAVRLRMAALISAARVRTEAFQLYDRVGLEVVIFSKDRAPQLELLLRSYFECFSNAPDPCVLFRSSTATHQRAYEILREDERFKAVRFVSEANFKSDLWNLLMVSPHPRVIFLVDDIVFVRPVEGRTITHWDFRKGILSLRLGRNITRSYNSGNVTQRLPSDLSASLDGHERLLHWNWRRAELDWSMPLSLDGNVFALSEIASVIPFLEFKAPNSLENALQTLNFMYKYRRGYCYERSKIVNLPLNSVKTEDFQFPHAGLDANGFSEEFISGLRLDLAGIDLDEHDSCHMTWVPNFR